MLFRSGVVSGAVDEVGSTRRTIVGRIRFILRDVHSATALHARISNDGCTVRTDVEVVNCEVAQGFELFIQDVLVDNRLTTVTWLHSDTP